LEISGEKLSTIDMKAYSVWGSEVFLPAIGERQWDVSNLAKGVYIIDIKSSDNHHTRAKFIKE
jgi:hypothetical protein